MKIRPYIKHGLFFLCWSAALLLIFSCGRPSKTETEAVPQFDEAKAEAEARAAAEEAARLEKLKIDSALQAYLDKLSLDERIA